MTNDVREAIVAVAGNINERFKQDPDDVIEMVQLVKDDVGDVIMDCDASVDTFRSCADYLEAYCWLIEKFGENIDRPIDIDKLKEVILDGKDD